MRTFSTILVFSNFCFRSKDSESKWVFCACNKPARTYTSLTNELKVSYVQAKRGNTTLAPQRNWFKIDYKFVPAQFGEVGQVRIVQDQVDTSLIGGFHLNVRVPPNHHLRVSGKSTRCRIAEHSYLAKWSLPTLVDVQTTRKSIVSSARHLELDQDAFRKECSYLFDVSEPMSSDVFVEREDEWLVSWFFNFDSPTDSYDFEIKWKFIKNVLVDEKKPSVISLPKEVGFESNKDGLVFLFK